MSGFPGDFSEPLIGENEGLLMAGSILKDVESHLGSWLLLDEPAAYARAVLSHAGIGILSEKNPFSSQARNHPRPPPELEGLPVES